MISRTKEHTGVKYPDVLDKSHTHYSRYLVSIHESPYMWQVAGVNEMLKKVCDEGDTVLEVGCSSGWHGELMNDWNKVCYYSGFDGGKDIVDYTFAHKGFDVWHGFADDPDSYVYDYDVVLCANVLEHIENDLEVVRLWEGKKFCISLPNFEVVGHLRWFSSMDDVLERYGDLLNVYETKVISPPSDRSHKTFVVIGTVRRFIKEPCETGDEE